MKSKRERGPVAGWKLWCFRILVPIVVPLGAVAALEAGLRIGGYGYPTDAIIRYDLDGEVCYSRNLRFGWRFFPESLAREPDVFVIPADKPEGTFRIFVLGGSAALGTPAAAYGFGRILNVMLEERFPDARFEVINVAMTAINSHVVLPIARACARFAPDLFVVYLGNNEVVGPYGAGTVFSPLSPSLWMIRAGLALKTTRTGQLIAGAADSLAPRAEIPPDWEGMRMFLENQVPFGAEALGHVYGHFESNLADICAAGTGAGAAVLLCTVACNLDDCPPFASQHRGGLAEADLKEWERLYARGAAAEDAGRVDDALADYHAAARLDDRFADLRYRMARCLARLGDRVRAAEEFAAARDLDTLRFRADGQINAAIRAVAEGRDSRVGLLDAVAIAAGAADDGIPGGDLFYDHVHYNFTGNYRLAAAMLERVARLLPDPASRPALSEEECARRLAFTGWDRHRVLQNVVTGFLKKPPFTNQLYHEDQVAEAEARLAELAAFTAFEGLAAARALYDEALALQPRDWKLRSRYALFLLDGLHDARAAAEHFRRVAEAVPDYGALAKLGGILTAQGRLDEAEECFRRVLELNPGYPPGHAALARVLAGKGELAAAAEHYARALKKDPGLPQAVLQEYEAVLRKLDR